MSRTGLAEFTGISRDSVRELRALVERSADPTGPEGPELFAVARLLDDQPGLRRLLTDPSRAGEERAALATQVLGDRVGPGVIDLVAAAATATWSRVRDLADAVEYAGVLAEVLAAERAGQLDDLEDELFRFGRIVVGDRGLRDAVGDRRVPAERRRELVTGLLADRATPSTCRLVGEAAAARGRTFTDALEAYGQVAADRRNRLVATVRTARPLDDEQQERLARILARQYGHDVRLNLIVDPEVVGGMRINIGADVFEGTMTGRLHEAGRLLAGTQQQQSRD